MVSSIFRVQCIGLCLMVAQACSVQVVPVPAPRDPAILYLADYGLLHTGIIFRKDDGSYVEYGFGDHAWYARGCNDPLTGLAALFLKTQGTLMRANHETLLGHLQQGTRVLPIVAPRDCVHGLMLKLEATWASSAAVTTPIIQERFPHGACVPSDSSYSIFNNCNHAASSWLSMVTGDARVSNRIASTVIQ